MHGKPQNKLGEGEFGLNFDVRPGKEEEAKLLREEWRKDHLQEPSSSKEDNTSVSDIDKSDISEDSEDDDAFLAKYDSDGNFIG